MEEAGEQQPGTADPGPQPACGLRVALETLRAAVAGVQAIPVWQVPSRDLAQVLVELAGVAARVAAVELAVVAEVHARGVGLAEGASSTAAWLRSVLALTPTAARERVRVAGALAGGDALTAAALAAGHVSYAAAAAVTEALAGVDGLPARAGRPGGGVDAATRHDAEAFLLGQARVLDAGGLRRVGRHLLHVLDPDGGARLASDEAAQLAARWVSWAWRDDGMLALSGVLDRVGGAAVLAALDPLAAPDTSDGVRDTRTAGRRRADAVVQLARSALAGGRLPLTGGERPTVVVSVDLATLRADLETAGVASSGVRAGELTPHGQPLSAAAARRMACDARVIPLVLGSASEPLDVGRATRTWPAGMRRAVHARDRGCVFPGCDRPPGWCQVHHILPWSHGGQTALSNAALLCDAHHDAVHHAGATVAMGADGHPVVTPPRWSGTRSVRPGAGRPPPRPWRADLADVDRRRRAREAET